MRLRGCDHRDSRLRDEREPGEHRAAVDGNGHTANAEIRLRCEDREAELLKPTLGDRIDSPDFRDKMLCTMLESGLPHVVDELPAESSEAQVVVHPDRLQQMHPTRGRVLVRGEQLLEVVPEVGVGRSHDVLIAIFGLHQTLNLTRPGVRVDGGAHPHTSETLVHGISGVRGKARPYLNEAFVDLLDLSAHRTSMTETNTPTLTTDSPRVRLPFTPERRRDLTPTDPGAYNELREICGKIARKRRAQDAADSARP